MWMQSARVRCSLSLSGCHLICGGRWLHTLEHETVEASAIGVGLHRRDGER